MKKLHIAAVGDIHVNENSAGQFNEIFEDIGSKADILLICGDFLGWGLPSEVEIFVKELYNCKIPILAVLGNHEFEGGKEKEITEILRQNKVQVMDGSTFIYKDVGFAGAKGFAGGFGQFMLNSWGEPPIKQFVAESVAESMKLENALSKLETEKKVVLLHYSPILGTVANEPKEILPFLGCSRLAEPIDRFNATVVFHGHAHHGPAEGATEKGIPVFNVALDLMKKANPAQPYMLFEV